MNEPDTANSQIDIRKVLEKQPILLFDGECSFCNRTVLFYLENEKKDGKRTKVRFAPLESAIGKELRRYFGLDPKIDSLILIKDHSAFIKSCAALRLTRYMKGVWPLMMIFVLIPPFIRNVVYDIIAKKRMKLFGRVENCALLDKEDRERFIDI
jgi:predicted DCC family thiol-disulfide oxidoreductase YuxK